jgi:hypothetical protein
MSHIRYLLLNENPIQRKYENDWGYISKDSITERHHMNYISFKS